MSSNLVIVIMGVSGSGKTTIGQLLSSKTGIPFFDGDDYHSQENIDKMKLGNSLNDTDRYEWLVTLNQLIKAQLTSNGGIVACSALKQKYRDILSKDVEGFVRFVYLEGTFDQVNERHIKRENHFIPSSLLQSQFDILEVPQNAFVVSIVQSPEKIVAKIQTELINMSTIGIVGLGVMGKSLCRNFAHKGVNISMYNRNIEGVEENIASNFKNEFEILSSAKAFDSIKDFVDSLQSPKKVLLMVPAGAATDQMILSLSNFLSAGDIIIDGGNSFYKDTISRYHDLKEKGIQFIGCGISGGEEGALYGPSLMPGGDKIVFDSVQYLLDLIAAKDVQGNPCCSYIGAHGAGHFVKMVHNGIEYAEMQLLAELYMVSKQLGYTEEAFAMLLTSWKQEGLDSYLLDITIQILQEKENEKPLLDAIIDMAESKGTGTWATVEVACEGIPATLMVGSLFARHLSSYKKERVHLNQSIPFNADNGILHLEEKQLKEAYQLARLINHFQGFWMIQEKSNKNQWGINLSEVARIWTNGCIIRSSLMQSLVSVLQSNNQILDDKSIAHLIATTRYSLSSMVAQCIQFQIAIPCHSEAINFLHGITTKNSGANLIQAQRDYFGAHGFQRYDANDGVLFHHHWVKHS